MENKHKRIVNIIIGIALFGLISYFLPSDIFSKDAAFALGIMAVMIFWWITKPVHLAVTALLPIIIVSILNIVPINTVLDDYASPIIVLLLGANILTLTWSITGLDKRIALKALIIIGPSVKQQLVVWFLLSTLLSAVLPNIVVAAVLCPIAIAMINNIEDAKNKLNYIKYLMLLAIVWGAGIGGFGTPMGGAINLVTITHIENLLGHEYMYYSWTLSMLPYFLILSLGLSLFFVFVKTDIKRLTVSKSYFKKAYDELGSISRSEIIAFVLFLVAILLAFTRPFYENILPAFKPPYAFMLMGIIALFITVGKKGKLIDWKYATGKINWGLMILFAGGLALGNLIVSTGAAGNIAQVIIDLQISSPYGLMVIFILLVMFLSNSSSNTAACAVLIPIVIGITSGLSYDPLPFVYLSAAACNCAFLLPTSIIAIPVTHGMDTKFILKKGLYGMLVSFACLAIAGYFAIMVF